MWLGLEKTLLIHMGRDDASVTHITGLATHLLAKFQGKKKKEKERGGVGGGASIISEQRPRKDAPAVWQCRQKNVNSL